jgi:hypothetical protein
MGLSFLLQPVPTNPQNHNAIVALSAGHGYYGTSPDGGPSRGGGGGGSSGGGIMGGGTGPAGWGASKLMPLCLLGIPISIGIMPGVYAAGAIAPGGKMVGDVAQIHDALTSTSTLMHKPYDEMWISSREEHAAHVCLQSLLGRVVWMFLSTDTKTYGDVVPSSTSVPSLPKRGQPHHRARRRLVSLTLAAPSRIGGPNAIPKVGIVCLTAPSPPILSTGMEITGNASYQNVTWNYINWERQQPLPPPARHLMLLCLRLPSNVAMFASCSSRTTCQLLLHCLRLSPLDVDAVAFAI